jgi:hypothetical protein
MKLLSGSEQHLKFEAAVRYYLLFPLSYNNRLGYVQIWMYLTILEKVESLIWGPTDYQKKRRGISKKKRRG